MVVAAARMPSGQTKILPSPQVRRGGLRRELSVGRICEGGHGRCMPGRVVYREEKEAAGAADQSRDWRACVLLSARARYL